MGRQISFLHSEIDSIGFLNEIKKETIESLIVNILK